MAAVAGRKAYKISKLKEITQLKEYLKYDIKLFRKLV